MDRDLCYLLNKSIDKFAERFVEKYFLAEDPDMKIDIHFVEDSMSDELNYNVFINDYYFSLQDLYHALRYDIPWEVIDKRYNEATSVIGWKAILQGRVSLKNFYLLNYKEWKRRENIDHTNGQLKQNQL